MKFTTLIALVGVATAIRIMDGPTTAEEDAAKKKLADPKEEDAKAKKFGQEEPCAEGDEKCKAQRKLAEPCAEGDEKCKAERAKGKFSQDGPATEEDAKKKKLADPKEEDAKAKKLAQETPCAEGDEKCKAQRKLAEPCAEGDEKCKAARGKLAQDGPATTEEEAKKGKKLAEPTDEEKAKAK